MLATVSAIRYFHALLQCCSLYDDHSFFIVSLSLTALLVSLQKHCSQHSEMYCLDLEFGSVTSPGKYDLDLGSIISNNEAPFMIDYIKDLDGGTA
jgi:hypothetical protein